MDPKTLKYTEDHEWIGEENGVWVVGITDFAQDQLGDITYIELPKVGKALSQGAEAAVVESVKAASDVFAPVAGTVAEVNSELEATPELVNQDPFGAGWFFKLSGVDPAQVAALMDEAAYRDYAENAE
jgi:glycine cleavage system H protein